jgi:hypothetical protein
MGKKPWVILGKIYEFTKLKQSYLGIVAPNDHDSSEGGTVRSSFEITMGI